MPCSGDTDNLGKAAQPRLPYVGRASHSITVMTMSPSSLKKSLKPYSVLGAFHFIFNLLKNSVGCFTGEEAEAQSE